MTNNQIIIAYGFEYDAFIGASKDMILCKCIESKNPFYAVPEFIAHNTVIEDINEMTNYIEQRRPAKFDKIHELARYRHLVNSEPVKLCWRIVIYNENSAYLNFDWTEINYESEGDENGDGR